MIKLQTPVFKKIEDQAQATPGCISFSQGALRVGGVPQAIRDYVQEIAKTDKADYYVNGLGIMLLREKIAAYVQQKHGAHINPRQVFVTHGGIGGLTSIFLALLEPGDDVILPVPTYPVYQNIVKMSRANPVFVDACFVKAGSSSAAKSTWAFDVDRVKAAITSKTKMIVLPNPSNPTGMVLSLSDILALKELCEQNKIYLVSDEVYEHFVFEGEFHSVTPFVAQSEYVLRVGSFSKNFSMSGWRIGFVVSPAHMIDTFSAIQSATICCPTAISQHAVMYALDHPELMAEQIAIVKQCRDIAYEGLLPLVHKGILSCAYPQASFYLFVKTPEKNCNDLVLDILHDAKVALAPGSDFGPFSTDSFRLCYARDPKLVHEGVARLVKFFEERY